MHRKWIPYIILAVLMYFPVFSHLDVLPIRIWDESRVAVNAIEMYDSGNALVTTFNDEPDLWNTKPPLTVWSQVFWMKILGPGELAVRLPSAISAFLCGLFLLWFFDRYFKRLWLGFVSSLLLITCPGFIAEHVSRTGDYDAMLVLFTTIYLVSIFQFIRTEKKKWMYIFFAALFLGFMTKSIAAFLFIPGVAVYILLTKNLIPILKNKHFYFGLLGLTTAISLFLLLRENADPGYVKAAFFNDVSGRFNDALDSHRGGFWYYYSYLVSGHLSIWHLLVPLGWALGFASKDLHIRKLNIFLICSALSYFLVISLAKTKIEWYDAPLIPILCIQAAIAVHFIFELLKDWDILDQKLRFNPLPYFLLFVLTINPYNRIIEQTFAPEELAWERPFYEPEYWLRSKIKSDDNQSWKVLRTDYSPHWRFYIRQAKVLGKDFQFTSPGDLKPFTENVVVFNQKDQQTIEQNWNFELLENANGIKAYHLKEKIVDQGQTQTED